MKKQVAALRMLTFAYGQAADGWERLAELEADEERSASTRRKSSSARREAGALGLARDRALDALERARDPVWR